MSNQKGNIMNFDLSNDCMEAFRGLPANGSKTYQQLLAFYNKYPETSLAAMPAIASELTIATGFPSMLDFFRCNHAAKAHVQPGCRFFSKLHLEPMPDTCKRIIKISDSDQYIYLPSGSGVYMALKRAAIQLAIKHSTCKQDIITFFGISNRHLRNIRA